MITEFTKLTHGNRVVIPASIRKSLGLRVGDALTIVLQDNGEVRLLIRSEAVRQEQQFISADCNLVEELLSERREEAGRERESE